MNLFLLIIFKKNASRDLLSRNVNIENFTVWESESDGEDLEQSLNSH